MSMISEEYEARIDKLERLIDNDKTLISVKLCMICQEKLPDCVFQPCGHGGVCFRCCDELLDHKDLCPFCRVVSNQNFLVTF